MPKTKKKSLAWEIYFYWFAYVILRNVFEYFSPNSIEHQYYQLLNAFDPHFLIPITLNGVQVLTNLIFLIPLAGFVYGFRIGPKILWQFGLLARLLLDFCGHSYDMQTITTYYYEDPNVFLFLILQATAFAVPSYIGCFVFAWFDAAETETKLTKNKKKK